MSKKETKEEWTLRGKPWSVDSRFSTFEKADTRRQELLTQWGDGTTMTVKVKRSPDDTFTVRTRDSAPPVKNKKKGKKKEKKNDTDI